MSHHVPARKSSPSPVPTPRLPRLEVGPTHDSLESEASRTADRIVNGPRPKTDHDAMRGAGGTGLHAEPLTNGGRTLDADTRAYFEPRFGYDFSKVRIHANDEASSQAQSLGANAYTAGSQIAFGAGRYAPASGEGRRLLAHELTHVVQQGAAQALPGFAGARPAAGLVGMRIQRDVPQGQQQQPQQGGELSITKSAGMVSRQEVTDALTTFLYKVQREQGGQTLHVDATVRNAVFRLSKGDPVVMRFLDGITPSDPPEFAAAITKLLPDMIPAEQVKFLGTLPAKVAKDTSPKSVGEAAGKIVVDSTVAPMVKKLPIPKAWQDKAIDAAKDGVATGMVSVVDAALSGAPIDDKYKAAIHAAVESAIKQKTGTPPERQQEGVGSPYAPVQPPSSFPGFPSVAGQHIFTLPSIRWDIPTKPLPKPNLPQPPTASDAKAVDAIIQGLDDKSLLPAAAKGKPEEADNWASARELARDLANRLSAANAKRQFTVELNLPMNYRGQPDLADVFDKVEAIVKQIAPAIPGDVPNVGEVIIQPARMPGDKTFPARRIVKLGGQ